MNPHQQNWWGFCVLTIAPNQPFDNTTNYVNFVQS